MKPNQKLANKDGVQVTLFPMEYMRITQSVDEGITHKGTMNIDIAGKDRGIDDLFAPVDLTCVQNNNTSYHTVIFWSDKKVLLPDGTIDYISIRVLHDNDVKDTPVGKKFKQGEIFYQEGTAGYATGNHAHLCVAKGHTKKVVKRESGWSDLDGSILPNDAFFINGTTIIDDGGLKWKNYVEPIIPDKPKLKVGDRVFIKKSAIRYATGQLIPPEYKKGGRYAQRPFTIAFDGDKSLRQLVHGSWLLKEIKSWVKEEDLEKV